MLLSTISVVAGLLAAETPDTLQTVTVIADRGVVVSRTDTLSLSNSISITDALASIPGVCVMDNGGAAGLKSVSIRGMGSPNAAIYVDGVRVGNVQSGQADLGMFNLANSGGIVIDYAQNSISFNTARPVFGDRSFGGKVRLRGGSFGTYEPSGRLDFKLSEKASLSATAGGIVSKGDFPTPDGSRRLNNDIGQIRAGLDSWGLTGGGDWHAKAYYNDAQRGTPGTVAWPSSDRQNDRNAFFQGLVREQFSPLYALHASAKLSIDNMEYLSEWGNNSYRQTEIQLNTAHKFSVRSWFDTSLSIDFIRDGLDSDLYDASRSSVFASVSTAFHPRRFKADIALEYSGTFDSDGQHRKVISPSLDFRWNASGGFDLLAFARRAFRTPTFNELFYPGYGNPDLKAEDAYLSGIGMEYSLSFHEKWSLLTKADGFFNYLKDKIVSAPTAEDPNIWLPYNVGTVRMEGTDIRTSLNYAGNRLNCGFSVRYSYQDATDRTSGSFSFGQQIPFISKHSVVLGADAEYEGWNLNVNWNWRGGRFDSAGRMPDYSTLDLTAGKDIELPSGLMLYVKIIARNLTDCRYELAGGYPMPGRAFYGEINLKF